ncbi:MAG: trypsin-like peptidase domain-containing protein [Sphingobacteriaceae bacterium]|nr:trypsin-like peptidase domain-containing protein [Cytophagaceae bacterium]
MFVEAIEAVDLFTRPIHTLSRTYGGLLIPGSSTLFFVNDEGVAVTCKHVAGLIAQAEGLNGQYGQFRAERDALPRDGRFKKNLGGLEAKYGYRPETLIQMKHHFVNAFDRIDTIDFHFHPTLDLAIVVFKGFTKTFYTSHATFMADPNQIKQGRSLCRLGYPFPEYTNYRHNPATDDIEWTAEGNPHSPRFPIDGIITRFAASEAGGAPTSIELSTPGLMGQSGGPLFDRAGRVYGMQSMTNHLHLGFDMENAEIVRQGRRVKVSNYPFLHVGHCVHVDRITEFLRGNGVRFFEG